MHVRPYITLPNESIGDFRTWMSRLVEDGFTKGLRNIRANGLTSDFTINGSVGRTPLDTL